MPNDSVAVVEERRVQLCACEDLDCAAAEGRYVVVIRSRRVTRDGIHQDRERPNDFDSLLPVSDSSLKCSGEARTDTRGTVCNERYLEGDEELIEVEQHFEKVVVAE